MVFLLGGPCPRKGSAAGWGLVLSSPSALCSQANNSGDEVLRQGVTTLFGKSADREDGRLGSPKKPSYRGQDASFFYRTEGEEVRK